MAAVRGTVGRVVVAAAIGAAACQSTETVEDDRPALVETAEDDATTTVAADPGATINEAAAAVVRQQRRLADPAPLGDLQAEFGIAPVVLPAGRITTTDLGTPITMALDGGWRLEYAAPSKVTLAAVGEPIGALRPAVVLFRPLGYVAPADAGFNRVAPGDNPWPADDLAGWIAEVPQVEVLDSGEMMVDGRRTEWFDVTVDEGAGPVIADCDPGDCLNLSYSGAHRPLVLRDAEWVRWYLIEDPAGPIFGIVAAELGDEDFVGRGDSLIRTLRIGESALHPVTGDTILGEAEIVSTGPHRFTGVPGVLWDVPQPTVVVQAPGRVSVSGPDPLIGVVRPEAFVERGEPVTSAAGLLDIFRTLEDWSVTADPPARLELAGGDLLTAIRFTLTGPPGGPTPPIVATAQLEDGDDARLAGWPRTSHTEGFAIDTAAGVLLISAESESAPLLERFRPFVETFVTQLQIDS